MADLDWNGDEVEALITAGSVAGLTEAAEHLLKEAKDLVPIDEAMLELSGVASVDEEDLTAAVSFDTPYAVIQHERLDFRHANGRQAKYLEQPFHGEREVMLAIIATAVRREIGG